MTIRGAFDFETYEWTKALCCGLVTSDGQQQFILNQTNPDGLVEDALRAMYESDCNEWWAHNMGKYDGLFLSAAAMRLGWRQSAILAGGNRVISLELSPPNAKRKLTINDTFALAPSGLRSLANDFELPSRKLFSEEDYSIDTRKWDPNKLREGCLVDCKLVLELLDKLESLFEDWGGKLKRTFSSSALSIVKANLKEQGKRLPSHFDAPEANPIARQGYYGARVEVFHHNPKAWLTEYDVCSAYPYAMSQPLPWKYIGKLSGDDVEQRMHWQESMMVRAKISVPHDMQIPPLPFKPAPDAGIFFPTGEWEAWFPACELYYAATIGVTVIPMEGLLYTTEQPFAEFLNNVYKLKSESKGAMRVFTKYVLNGCYGKFGEKPEHTGLEIFPTEYEGIRYQMEHPGTANPVADDNRVLAVASERWATHAHFAIASYITGRARIALHRYLIESNAPAYCDTDSIHCIAWNGETSNQLGALKVELERYKGEFFAPKIYRLTEENGNQHLACKGFPVNGNAFGKMVDSARVRVDVRRKHTRINSMHIQGGKLGVEVSRMRLLKSQLKDGGETVGRISQHKTWGGLSMKRKPFQDGSTEPWTVKELLAGEHKNAVCPLLNSPPTDKDSDP